MKEKIQGEENYCHYAELTCAEERCKRSQPFSEGSLVTFQRFFIRIWLTEAMCCFLHLDVFCGFCARILCRMANQS